MTDKQSKIAVLNKIEDTIFSFQQYAEVMKNKSSDLKVEELCNKFITDISNLLIFSAEQLTPEDFHDFIPPSKISKRDARSQNKQIFNHNISKFQSDKIDNLKALDHLLAVYAFYVYLVSNIEAGLMPFSYAADRSFVMNEEISNTSKEFADCVTKAEKIFSDYESHAKDDNDHIQVKKDLVKI